MAVFLLRRAAEDSSWPPLSHCMPILSGDYRAGGLALVGAQPVREALERGQVDTLVIAAKPEQVRGADAAANDLVTLAKQTSASVRFIENPRLLADVGGVGASLRYLS
jgi:peptide subunit release factor 1 (eRF1)